jgi:hypothetical protein
VRACGWIHLSLAKKKHHRVQTTLKTMLALNENEMVHIKIRDNASLHPEALTSKIIV